ncbi:MAG: hypothetical protein IPL32_07370 [Chloracidobacterium sp.]|nr:hypothetical protein [Chloracidobacterium sp.]
MPGFASACRGCDQPERYTQIIFSDLDNNTLKSEPLIFPRGVRFPTRNDIPPADADEILERVSRAQITTGYIISQAEGQAFDAYIEANVHAPEVFEVFRNLCFSLLPEIASPLIGLKDEEPIFGPYTYRADAVGVLESYKDILENDGFLEFGLIHQSEIVFEEIFVASPKYFKIWTKNGGLAEEILQSARIPKCATLEFIDEYPMVSLSIGDNGNAAWTIPYHAIQDEFARLPKPEMPKDA